MKNSKNPIAYLKHIVKDPINTIAEADARKKEIMPVLYISLGIMIIPAIVMVFVDLTFLTIISLIGLCGVGFCAFLLSVISGAKKRFACLTCDKCHNLAEIKTAEDFVKYISYTVEKDEAVFNGYSGNKEPTDGVYSLVKFSGSSNAVVSVALTCPHCGEVKQLKYSATPFKCHAEEKKVGVLAFPNVRATLENAVRTAVDNYNNPDKKESVPYSLHSSKNPNFEARTTFKGANAAGARPNYMGAIIDYHKDVEEMLEHYFVLNELNGSLTDPSKSKKSK